MKKLRMFLLFGLIFCNPLAAITDLNQLCQDFVLETKRIFVPQHPLSFNPSIIRFEGRLLMFFRIRDPETKSTNQIGVTWLDDDFNPEGEPQIFEIAPANPPLLILEENPAVPTVQDPRLIEIDGALYMVYTNLATVANSNVQRIFISRISREGEKFYGESPDVLLDYEGKIDHRKEKNWAPFEFEGELHLAYSLNPHLIFKPISGTATCLTVASSKSSFKWYYGEPRGGTPGLMLDGEYLAFFHCSKGMATLQSNGECITHYFMGAYTYAATPPFQITKISPKPIMHPSFYDGPSYETWKPLRVVFPCGYVMDDDYIWISYGKQDFEMWVAKIDKKKLLSSLTPVTTIE